MQLAVGGLQLAGKTEDVILRYSEGSTFSTLCPLPSLANEILIELQKIYFHPRFRLR